MSEEKNILWELFRMVMAASQLRPIELELAKRVLPGDHLYRRIGEGSRPNPQATADDNSVVEIVNGIDPNPYIVEQVQIHNSEVVGGGCRSRVMGDLRVCYTLRPEEEQENQEKLEFNSPEYFRRINDIEVDYSSVFVTPELHATLQQRSPAIYAQVLMEAAKRGDWSFVDFKIPRVCNEQLFIDWAYQEGLLHEHGNVRDLAASLLEKAKIPEDQFATMRKRLAQVMTKDTNQYAQFRAACALASKGAGKYENQVRSVLERMTEPELMGIARQYLTKLYKVI